jgi:superfamily II RNA helicase
MEYKGLILDKFQEDAIKAIQNNHSVVVSAPTGSGKTLIADYIIGRDVKRGVRVIYTAPIKALSNQKYKEFTADYGEVKVGLLTGDVVINPGALILIMTTEIYRNMVLSNDKMIENVSYVVLDEIHYINDIERGYVWEESIIFSKPHVRFLCLSATIPNVREFAQWIHSIKGHTVETVKHEHRSVPLHRKFYDAELGITTLEDIRDVRDIPDYRHIFGRRRQRRPRIKAPNHIELIKDIKDKLPCFFFNFSRQRCQDFALEICRAKIFETNPGISTIMRKWLDSAPPEVKSLKSMQILRQTLPYGVAFHHAGLIPIVRLAVEDLFSKGLIKVLYTTETFAVGINMPAKTVCFQSLRKFDGANFRFLNSKEYFQIAGRAGRRGIDKEGFVYAMVDRRDFDYPTLKKITSADLEPIKSQFRLSVNSVLNMIKQHTPEEIEVILKMSFYTHQKGSHEIKNSFENMRRKLAKKGYTHEGKLTYKGEFSSKIYADEIIIGDIFATDFYKDLNEYQIMLIVASLCYEPREKTEFYKTYDSKFLQDLKRKMHDDFASEKKFHYALQLTALIDPCYHGKNIFYIMRNTNFLEGDVIRFFRQMIDRLSQISNATQDFRLRQIARSCNDAIFTSLANIDVI